MITLILSSANMGDEADAVDFDLWVSFVNENIDERVGAMVEVDQFRFGATGPDHIGGASEEQRATIRRLLAVDLWEEFCGEVWARMRRGYDAGRTVYAA